LTFNLKKNAVYGASWTTLEFILLAVIQLAHLMILARVLSPSDFGIFAIGTFFTNLGNSVFALGLGPALIQKKGEIVDYLDTAWSANLIISIIATILLLLIAPSIIDAFFEESKALLPVLVLLSVILISGFNNIGIVLFLKKIQMKRVVAYHVLPKLIGVITAIIMSIILKNYWGLVIGLVVEFLSRMILSYILIPRMPKFIVEKNKFIELYSFGGWLQLKNLFNWATKNVDVAIIGSVLGTNLLGFYNRATLMAQLPNAHINKVVNFVSFPWYSSIQNDHSKLKNSIYINNELVIVILMPILIVTLFFGEETVSMLLGDDWIYLTHAFQLLIIAYGIEAYFFSFTPILRAIGLPKYEFIYFTIKISVLILFMYPLVTLYELVGAGICIILSVAISGPYLLYKVKKYINISLNEISKNIIVNIPIFILLFIIQHQFYENEANNIIPYILHSSILITIYVITNLLVYYIFNLGPIRSVLRVYKVIQKK
jgi:PST family polysaccharide transporter